jgi:hypothetical protein
MRPPTEAAPLQRQTLARLSKIPERRDCNHDQRDNNSAYFYGFIEIGIFGVGNAISAHD